jgi:hypothetical protein
MDIDDDNGRIHRWPLGIALAVVVESLLFWQ